MSRQAVRPINEMSVSFPALSENERFARLAVSGFLSQLDPNIAELSDIKTAVSEAVTNAIVHGYRETKEKNSVLYFSEPVWELKLRVWLQNR